MPGLGSLRKHLDMGKYFIKIFARYGNVIVDAVTANVLMPPVSLGGNLFWQPEARSMTTQYQHTH